MPSRFVRPARPPIGPHGLRVVVAYTPDRITRPTRVWGEEHGAEFRDVGSDGEAYFRLLAELWREAEPFMLVEHDVVPPPFAVQGLAECAEPWCGHMYRYPQEELEPGPLGCTRFSAEILRRVPDAVEESAEEHGRCRWSVWWERGPRDYHMLDQRLRYVLERAGYTFHVHEPEAEHLRSIASLYADNMQRLGLSIWRLREAFASTSH